MQATKARKASQQYTHAYLQLAAIVFLSLALALGNQASAEGVLATKPEDAWLQLAQLIEDEKSPLLSPDHKPIKQQKSWAFAIDNDLLVPGHRDQDYTYGVNFTQTGPQVNKAAISLNRPLKALDTWLGLEQSNANIEQRYIREIGIYGFTPEDKSLTTVNTNDRPYAGLVYLSSGREQIDWAEGLAWKSSLTLGLLGTPLVGNIQNQVHRLTGGERAKGWDNQISNGGELTARYQIARQQQLHWGSDKLELKSTVQASVGYLTEASWGLSFRRGLINSNWSSFNPDLTSYGERSSYDSNTRQVVEHYFWGGFALKLRAYNAFVQGQFRDSALSYDRNQLNSALVEGWLGYTLALPNGLRFSYVMRGHTNEVRKGVGARNLLWGSLIVAKSI